MCKESKMAARILRCETPASVGKIDESEDSSEISEIIQKNQGN